MRPQFRSSRQSETAACGLLLSHTVRAVSDILCVVRNSIPLLSFLLIASAVGLLLSVQPAHSSPQDGAAPSAPDQAPPPTAPPAPPVPSGPFIVLDPAHGGTDSGARGEGGVAEKDIVLQMARTIRAELERQGYHVVLTRSDDSNPSYDDRTALANGRHDAIFISLHVSSTGTAGVARVYYNKFGASTASSAATGLSSKNANGQTGGMLVWEEAQRPYVETSHRVADLVQLELAKLFAGSPSSSTPMAVRALRSVAGPAIAIELSSISASSQDSLMATAAPMAGAIARSVSALRQSTSTEAK
jgi:N-acetylmuramoyl-L-alanine amidase